MMIVNDCTIANKTNTNYSISSYSDTECESDMKQGLEIHNIRVDYKMMTQEFIPDLFEQYGVTSPVISKRRLTDLMDDFAISNTLNVVKTVITVVESFLNNLNGLDWLLQQDNSNVQNDNIIVYDFIDNGTTFFGEKYQEDETYGYLSVDFGQDEIVLNQLWVANSLVSLLAALGGYLTILTGFFGVL